LRAEHPPEYLTALRLAMISVRENHDAVAVAASKSDHVLEATVVAVPVGRA